MKKNTTVKLSLFFTALLLFTNQSAEASSRPLLSQDKVLFFQKMEEEGQNR